MYNNIMRIIGDGVKMALSPKCIYEIALFLSFSILSTLSTASTSLKYGESKNTLRLMSKPSQI